MDLFDLMLADSEKKLPVKLKDDIDKLIKIAHSKGTLQSVTIIHWLNEKGMPDSYSDVIDYLQRYGVTVIEDDEESLTATQKILDSNKILIQQKPLSIEGIITRLKRDEIELDTEFQRKTHYCHAAAVVVVSVSVVTALPFSSVSVTGSPFSSVAMVWSGAVVCCSTASLSR